MVLELFQSQQTSKPCPSCLGLHFWEDLQGAQNCVRCLPPPPRDEYIRRRLELDAAGTLVDTTERDFRLRFPDETWDYFDHITEVDRAYLAQAPSRTPCVWCGRRGGQHSPACERLHDAWDLEMPFGRYKGQKLKNLQPDYLRFLLGWDKLHGDIRREICRLLKIPMKEPISDNPD
jgi:uncharacterized protein (DUF3820 family)